MKFTDFTFYKNTPLTNIQNTIHFSSNEERDRFFTEKYENLKFSGNFNFRQDRGVIHVPFLYDKLNGFNYCKFLHGFDNKIYYAYIIGQTYINDNNTRLDLLIDPIMTYCQGNVLENIGYVDIIRSHLNKQTYNLMIENLRTSNDTPTVTTLRESAVLSETFGDVWVLLYSTVNLESDFGSEKKPKVFASTGGVYDSITSPVDLYVIDRNNFFDFTNKMSSFPWIMQNITKCVLIPKKFIDQNDLKKINVKSAKFDKDIFKLRSNNSSPDIDSELNRYTSDLYHLFNLDKEQEKHLLRSGLMSIDVTDFKGQTLPLDMSKINTLEMTYKSVVGYFNNIKVIFKGYGARDLKEGRAGHYLNYALTFDEFDELPTMINSGALAKAMTSYSRELANDRQISGRLKKIQGSGDLKDRVFNSLSVYSDVFSNGISGAPSKVIGLYQNEYEYYRDQDAQLAEMSLQPPKVSQQTNGNSLLIKTGDWGLHLMISTINQQEMDKVKQFYNMFGFSIDKRMTLFGLIDSNEHCNWLQFKGSWKMDNVDVELLNQMRQIFEGGVRFWHNNGSTNPFNNLMTDNRMVK
jgi:tail protein